MSLIGGETAEMPGLYQDQDYDLAGFCVGLAEKDRLVDGHLVKADDVLIGLASSGPHANGYSLIRKILAETGHRLNDPFDGGAPDDGGTLGDVLLEPTRIYVKPLLELMGHVPVHAMAHITGGGLVENIPRVLPEALRATITTGAWQVPPVFAWLEKQGGVPINEMYRTFNCGIGMVVCVAPDDAETALQRLREAGEQAWIIGSVETRGQAQEPLVLRD
jgi:phosphoribosylformylglycinamidine cyclo-ligase